MRLVLYSLRRTAADDAVSHLRRSPDFAGSVAAVGHDELSGVLGEGPVDIVVVDHFSTPDFHRFELAFGACDAPRVVGTRHEPDLIRDDVEAAGFDATVSLGGNATLESFRDELDGVLARCRVAGYQRPAGVLDERQVVRAFSVVYVDRIDYAIGSRVSQGMTDIEIANAFGFAVQTIRNRIHRILERSRLRNRTELAVHHPRAVIVQPDGSISGRVDVR